MSGIKLTEIRKANVEDLEGITEIYNYAILKTIATFDTEPKTLDAQKRWFEAHKMRHPILVAEEKGSIVGWAALTAWSDRCAYSGTAEISLYIKEGYRGRGLGKKLGKAILQKGKAAGLHTVIARISEGNDTSIHLFETLGFNNIGTMKEVGKKFGKLIDVHLMQKIY